MIPEQTLWRAVVNQAFYDASSNPPIDILSFTDWLPRRRKRLEGKGLEPESEIAEQSAYCRYVRAAHAAVDGWENDRTKARQWFLRKPADYYEVCRNAGYDPDYISTAARKFESQGWNVNPEALAA